jgi:hypothetical protein
MAVKNLGQRKLTKWLGDKSMRQGARDIGVDYRSFYRWLIEGVTPGYAGRKACRDVAGVAYEDWERR